jgi:hypothetical protein
MSRATKNVITGAAVLAAVVFASFLPDLRRYMKIRNM